MADRHPEISGAVIVLLGSFNPRIFQPEWFVRQNLLPEKEAQAADIKVIVPQVCHFETERFVVQAMEERFVASTKANTNSASLRDLVQGAFYILEHTPVSALGLNFAKHFAMSSEENWHKIGDRLAPKDGWNEVLEGRPGLRSMVILTNKTEPKGALFTVKVEPSLSVKHGVYFETNEHYPAPETEPLKGLMDILAVRWEGAEAYASRVVDHILTWSETNR
jgi:hypothetical protein